MWAGYLVYHRNVAKWCPELISFVAGKNAVFSFLRGVEATDLARTFVIRVNGNKAEWVDVKTGARAGDRIKIFGDLRAGDNVVLRGTDELRPGTEVNPTTVASDASYP